MATYVPVPSPGAIDILTDGVIKVDARSAAEALVLAKMAAAVGPQVATQVGAALDMSGALKVIIDEAMKNQVVEYTLTQNTDPTEAPPGTWSVQFIGYLREQGPFRLPSYIGMKPHGCGRGKQTFFRTPREHAVDLIMDALGPVDGFAEGVLDLAENARAAADAAGERKALDRLIQRVMELQPSPRQQPSGWTKWEEIAYED